MASSNRDHSPRSVSTGVIPTDPLSSDDAAPRPHPNTAAPLHSLVRKRAEQLLRELVGHPNCILHDDQWRAIEALVCGRRRTLVVQRTGWGKSAVYFIATALLRQGWGGWQAGDPSPSSDNCQCAGATVIISPLLALMRDQVAAAQRAGINAVTINSANATAWAEIEEQIRAGSVDVLLVSPERLNNPVFREEMAPQLAANAGLVVIDEVHCVSDWGHDFRPDYRRIRTLLAELPPGTPVLATTATANARVTTDVAEQLATPGENRHAAALTTSSATKASADDGATEVLVLRGPLARHSLHLGQRLLPDAASRLAWLTTYLRTATGSGIVYCLTVCAAHEVAERLQEAGLTVRVYTGKTDPAEREQLEEDLRHNRVRALVATSALGMGFDKPDLAFVVHLGAPSSPVAYYQQVGRAGRGVDRAEVILLPGAEDQAIWDWFDSQGFPPESEVRAVLAALEQARGTGVSALSTAVLETVTSLRRTRLESMLKVLDVDGAVRRVRGGWVSTGQPWSYDVERYARVAAARQAERDAMLSYERLEAPACRMAFLRQVLDDPELEASWRCGHCDLCGGLNLPELPDTTEVTAARQSLNRVGASVEPRRQWPTGMARLGLPEFKGRISDAEGAGIGIAVGRLDGLGLSATLREFVEATADGPVPQALRPAVLEVAHRLAQQISQAEEESAPPPSAEVPAPSSSGLVVVLVDSRSHPQRLRQLGNAVAHTLGATALGIITVSGAPGRHDVGSAFRLAEVARSLSLAGWGRRQLERLRGAEVVLVDDWTDSGWTLTVAAALLRRAGAADVHPLVLARR
ncbi:ATP-dependent DNA helicase recQ [Actinomyces bovis]|uniref:DNA 3'-5' helicase n=1 Tax=Actinomyces bovis TaxID=1658 RepID=A0ABY1VPA7_9ACTO|nr:DEAD/DEAH box helicase [Actinomyces bovis]SPT53951.1 ATP-dependent DNA helicase recQ [Actinomyces bovis]VEG53469.1 ATP-dependent DNA helicase recQ [Actinomyces israelii]